MITNEQLTNSFQEIEKGFDKILSALVELKHKFQNELLRNPSDYADFTADDAVIWFIEDLAS